MTLTDTQLTRASGAPMGLSNIQAATLAGGASDNSLDASGFSGDAWLYGGDGHDTLRGGSGHDYLDGGLGNDHLFGGAGDDIIVAIQGSGATIAAGAGDDVVYGSALNDSIMGEAGRDRIYGRGGDDIISGGAGDDIIDGGAGNDQLSGDLDSDAIVGGADNDTLYAYNTTGVGDDGAVNYLYGDFGTAGDEPGVGNDTLIAGSGSELSFGEGGVNSYSGGGSGAVTHDGRAAGLRPTTPPAEPPVPAPTAWPPVLAGQLTTFVDGITTTGRWTELMGSASGRGISNSPATAQSPALAIGAAGPYVAWIDGRIGSPQVYVALNTIAGWRELAGSAHEGGISLLPGAANSSAEKPAIAVDASSQPIVAWTQVVGANRNIFVARYDVLANSGNGGWVSLGNSLSVGGISGTGRAEDAAIVMTAAGPVVAWLETTGGIKNVYAKRFDGTNWVALGSTGASGSGISASASSVNEFAIAAQQNGVSIAWTQSLGGRSQIYARTLVGNSWNAIGSSTSGNGISGTAGNANKPSLAYAGIDLFAAWQDTSSGVSEIYAAKFDGASWTDAGEQSHSLGGVSNTGGSATLPKLAAVGDDITLVWQDDRRAAGTGNSTALYVKRWRVNQFVEELPGDARDRGLTSLVGSPGTHAVAMDAAGHPMVVWSDTASGKSEIYLQANKFDLGTIHYVNDADTTAESVAVNSFNTLPGHDSNDGLTPQSAKRTLQAVINDAARPLSVGDVILVDAGSYTGATFSGAASNGILLLGSTDEPAILTGPLNVNNVSNLAITGVRSLSGVRVTGGNQVTIQGGEFYNTGVTLSAGSKLMVVGNQFTNASTGIALVNNTSDAAVIGNTLRGGDRGIALQPGSTINATTGVLIRQNQTSGTSWGLSIETAGQGRIENNRFENATTAIHLPSSFSGLITDNQAIYSQTGVYYAAGNLLDANLIYGNATGIRTIVNSATTGLGYFGSTRPNRVVKNNTGIVLQNALVQNQYLAFNTSGIVGTGNVEPLSLELANQINRSVVAIDVTGTITNNRLSRNQTGIKSKSGQLITHNELTDNLLGIDVTSINDARIFSNTLVTKLGTNIRVTGASRQTEIRSNLLWTDDGYNIYVADDSTSGFFSDYNSLIAGPDGKLVYWTKDFVDILDWQEDVYQFDLHSTGTTVVDPTNAQPRFVARWLDDLRVFDQTAQLRFTSPSLDVADPRSDQGRAATFINLLSNPSFESGLSDWTVTPSAATATANPPAYDGSSYFTAASNPTTSLEQTVDLITSGYVPADIDALKYAVTYGARVRSAAEDLKDLGKLTLTFVDQNGTTIGTPQVIQSSNVSDRWELIGDRSYLPGGTRKIRFRVDAVRQAGSTNDVYVDHAFISLLSRSAGVDAGRQGNTANDVDTAPHLRLTTPDLYKDWERNKPIDIRWDSFGNTLGSPVSIDLLQDTANGTQLVTHITTGTADDGVFTWIAANSGIDFGTRGLRIDISLAANPTVRDRSSESFTIPEDTTTYFVNDPSITGGEFTSVPGNNRNTGKAASAPKPYPNNVLRIYSLTANDTLSVDTGTYPLLYPLSVSNILGLGDDEGFIFQGAAEHNTTFAHANPFTSAPMLELNDADFMTLNNLTLSGGTIGLYVRNLSQGLNADRVRVQNSTQRGILIDSGSSAQLLKRLDVDGSSGPGFKMVGSLVSLQESQFRNNRGIGLELQDTGATAIEGNEISNNRGNGAYGVSIINSSGPATLFGSPALTPGRGNVVHDNSLGIVATGVVQVVGNTVFNHIGSNVYGIVLSSGSTATRNVVYDNTFGIYTNTGAVTENRIYHNSQAGISVDGSPTIQRNIIYSNAMGIRGGFAYGGTITGNIIYANSDSAIYLSRAAYYNATTDVNIVNNTLYQPTGDGVRLNDSSRNVSLRNNIIWVNSGYALNVAADSQAGFRSDYNDLYATGSGAIAFWQGIARPTLGVWRTTAFTDANSLSVDPKFVNVTGADGVLGYSTLTSDGRDDDFHLQSQYGSFHGIAFAPVATLSGAGAPEMLTAAGNPVLDATTSALLDRGDPDDSFTGEPKPDGSYINIGAYGGTSQASISPAE